MIIAFYPGGGGNRYLQRLLGNPWQTTNVSYDNTHRTQLNKHRYLFSTPPEKTNKLILTHCMNSQRIHEVFPDSDIVFINTDLRASLRREWVLHGHTQYMNKKINSQVSRLEHYNAFKDPAWPPASTQSELDCLPRDILQEVNKDYSKVVAEVPAVPGKLAKITQEYIDKINSAYENIRWNLKYYQDFPVDFSRATQIINVNSDTDEFSSVMKQELSLYPSELYDRVWDEINHD